ncbi:MAG: carboxypeptidase-like regulatory domain-containing protein [Saprospiraceae bacterium]|nr:carboxypeptidase-like regulatory domain-containing protein [Saprospiraceae bacterium]
MCYKISLFVLLTLPSWCVVGQNIKGKIVNTLTKEPVIFANIGVLNKGIGTVSDENGDFLLNLDKAAETDTLMISCIGFQSFTHSVAQFRQLKSYTIALKERVYEMPELVVKAKNWIQKTLGVQTQSRTVSAGFENNELGYEMGILMKVKKEAIPETIKINIADCTFDSIFYRVNIYKYDDKKTFESVLQKPIYLQLSKSIMSETIIVDLKPYNLQIKGDFLVTLEHIKNLGKGKLHFCSKLGTRSYYRMTSQASWATLPVGISISVDAKVEK